MSWPFLLIIIPLLRYTKIDSYCAIFQHHIGFFLGPVTCPCPNGPIGPHTNSQPGCGCVCVFGLVSLCLADGHWAHREEGGGRSSNKPFRTESEYTYYTEMLYEKPMWFWKISQYKSILVYLNNGIMISRNGHDIGPLKEI